MVLAPENMMNLGFQKAITTYTIQKRYLLSNVQFE